MWNKIKSWFVKTLDLNKDGKITAKDIELAKTIAEKTYREANDTINKAAIEVKEVVAETQKRAARVKEELVDVITAVKEVANQTGDIVAAVKGKERKGRKRK